MKPTGQSSARTMRIRLFLPLVLSEPDFVMRVVKQTDVAVGHELD